MFNNLLQSWQFWTACYVVLAFWTAVRWMVETNDGRINTEGEGYPWWANLYAAVVFTALYPVFLVAYQRGARRELKEVIPIFGWFWRRYYGRKDEERRRREDEHQEKLRRREERINAWKRENPPIIFYNTIAGITVAVRADDYELGKERTTRAIVDGDWAGDAPCLVPIQKTFIFCETATIGVVSCQYLAGRKSELMVGMAKVARLDQRPDIFVPFVSDALLSFDEQKKRIDPATNCVVGPGLSETYVRSSAQNSAREYLLKIRNFPSEVLEVR